MTYTYDHRNRLVQVDENNTSGTWARSAYYQYDAFGRRLSKTVQVYAQSTVVTYFYYDLDDVMLALDPSGNVRNRYLHGSAVDEVLADENSMGGVLWALRDQFYNVRDLVDHNGGHYNHIDYDTFGSVKTEYRPNNGFNLVHCFGFQSRERDQETGLNYHRTRYLGTAIGRWMSEDTIGFESGDSNLNRFVGNSPTNFSDPFGTAPISDEQRAFLARQPRAPEDPNGIVIDFSAPPPLPPYDGPSISASYDPRTLEEQLRDDKYLDLLREEASGKSLDSDEREWLTNDRLRRIRDHEARKSGSYTNRHKSGTEYHGKGDRERAKVSARDQANEHNDPHVKTNWKPAPNDRQAFIDEARRIERGGGVGSSRNYNIRNSPGRRYLPRR